jgi:acetoin utilization protein AcuB
MRLSDVMSVPVRTVRPLESAEEAWNRMKLYRVHHLVVVDARERIVGLLSDRDLGGPRGAPVREGRSVADLMTRRVVTATPEETVRATANLFRGRQISCLPVLRDGRLAGIVTVTDLLTLIGRGAERPVARTKRWTLRHRARRRGAGRAAARAAGAGRL